MNGTLAGCGAKGVILFAGSTRPTLSHPAP
jgi:hypothetical protein